MHSAINLSLIFFLDRRGNSKEHPSNDFYYKSLSSNNTKTDTSTKADEIYTSKKHPSSFAIS